MSENNGARSYKGEVIGDSMAITIADENIGNLLDKHIVEERVEREELAEKVAWYEKNINPLSWGKRKKK